MGGEGKGFLWIADHIARTPGSDPTPKTQGKSQKEKAVRVRGQVTSAGIVSRHNKEADP